MSANIGFISLLVIGIVAAFLWFRRDYEDGLIGHLALAGLAGTALVAVIKSAGGYQYYFMPEVVVILVCVALFMLRHAYRFLLWRNTGKNDWAKKADPDATHH
ncbi:MAG: hypothetical protein ACYC36_03790 [Bellilinea sp.]